MEATKFRYRLQRKERVLFTLQRVGLIDLEPIERKKSVPKKLRVERVTSRARTFWDERSEGEVQVSP